MFISYTKIVNKVCEAYHFAFTKFRLVCVEFTWSPNDCIMPHNLNPPHAHFPLPLALMCWCADLWMYIPPNVHKRQESVDANGPQVNKWKPAWTWWTEWPHTSQGNIKYFNEIRVLINFVPFPKQFLINFIFLLPVWLQFGFPQDFVFPFDAFESLCFWKWYLL